MEQVFNRKVLVPIISNNIVTIFEVRKVIVSWMRKRIFERKGSS